MKFPYIKVFIEAFNKIYEYVLVAMGYLTIAAVKRMVI